MSSIREQKGQGFWVCWFRWKQERKKNKKGLWFGLYFELQKHKKKKKKEMNQKCY